MRASFPRTALAALIAVGALGWGGSPILAQSTPSSGQESSTKRDANGNPVPDTRVDATVDQTSQTNQTNTNPQDNAPPQEVPPPRYTAALNGDRLILLGQSRNFRMFYGASISEIGDDHLGNSPSPLPGSMSLVTPTVGFIGDTARTEYVVQYTVTLGTMNQYDPGLRAYQRGSFGITGELTRAWSWNLSANVRYGVDLLSLLPGLTFTAFDDVAVVNGNSALLLVGQQNLLNDTEQAGVKYQPSARTRFLFEGGHTFYSVSDEHLQTNVGTYDFAYEHDFSREFTMKAYTSGGLYFGQTAERGCFYEGAGVGATWKPTARLKFFGEGGPDHGNSECLTSYGATGDGGVLYVLGPSTTLYATVLRSMYAPLLLPQPETVTTVSAGFGKEYHRGLLLRFDTGYTHLIDITLEGRLNGYFVAPTVGWRLSRAITATLNYRYMYQIVIDKNVGRNQVIYTIDWHPSATGLYK